MCMYVVVSFSKAWNKPSKTCSIDVMANLSLLLPINDSGGTFILYESLFWKGYLLI